MATSESLQDFLSGDRMTKIAQSFSEKRGLPDVLPAAFSTPSNRKPSNGKVEYFSVAGSRQLATLVHRNSPSVTREVKGATRKYADCVNPKESFVLDADFLEALHSNMPVTKQNAQNTLLNWMEDQVAIFRNTRGALISSAFALGAIYADGDGNVLPSSTGAAVTVDYGIATGNKLTKAGADGTYNIGDWSSTTTDVNGKLKAIRVANLKANGYRLSTIFYGSDVPGYLMANTTLKDYWVRHDSIREAVAMGNQIPNGVLGYNWVPVEEAYFLDADNTARSWFPSNFLGILPDVSPEWYEFIEGGTAVPVPGIANVTSAGNPGDSIQIVNGVYSYATPRSYDPVQQKLIMGDCFLPLIKVPGTYYFGTCS